MKKSYLPLLLAAGLTTQLFAEKKIYSMKDQDKKEAVITSVMSKAQVDSIGNVLNAADIKLTINKIEYDGQHNIKKLEGFVSSSSRKLTFASDKFKKLEIFYGQGLDIHMYSN